MRIELSVSMFSTGISISSVLLETHVAIANNMGLKGKVWKLLQHPPREGQVSHQLRVYLEAPHETHYSTCMTGVRFKWYRADTRRNMSENGCYDL